MAVFGGSERRLKPKIRLCNHNQMYANVSDPTPPYKSLLQINNWSSRILDVPDMGHTLPLFTRLFLL